MDGIIFLEDLGRRGVGFVGDRLSEEVAAPEELGLFAEGGVDTVGE